MAQSVSRNLDRSGGTIESGKREYLLRTIGRFESISEVGELIPARRGDQVIRLSMSPRFDWASSRNAR